jgi:hypothetical protein
MTDLKLKWSYPAMTKPCSIESCTNQAAANSHDLCEHHMGEFKAFLQQKYNR